MSCHRLYLLLAVALLVIPLHADALFTAAQTGDLAGVREMVTAKPELANAKNNVGSTVLMWAALYGRAPVVAWLLDHGADVAASNGAGVTALHLAAMQGRADVVAALIKGGADVHAAAQGLFQRTPLHEAINQGAAAALLAAGADPNAVTTFGETPLYTATKRGNIDVMLALLEKGAEVDHAATTPDADTPAQLALQEGNSNAADLLIQHGAKLTQTDHAGHALLPLACGNHCLSTVKLLLENGVDVNALDNAHDSALISAARADDTEIVALLLENGAKVDLAGANGTTPIFYAKSVAVANLLLQHGAKLAVVAADGVQPIHYAARAADRDTVALFLDKGEDANARDKQGRTPILWAAMAAGKEKEGSNRKEIIALLVAKGAVFNARANDGATALHYATQWGQRDTIIYLISNGMDVNARDNGGFTPLHWAAQDDKRKDMLALLIMKGANVNARAQDGRTPLAIAHKAKQQANIDILRQYMAVE